MMISGNGEGVKKELDYKWECERRGRKRKEIRACFGTKSTKKKAQSALH